MKTAQLFHHEGSQAVRLPQEFRFDGDKVYIKQVGNTVVLSPYDATWQTLFESVDEFSDDFLETRNQPTQQQREELF